MIYRLFMTVGDIEAPAWKSFGALLLLGAIALVAGSAFFAAIYLVVQLCWILL